jgi:hypothetical protein
MVAVARGARAGGHALENDAEVVVCPQRLDKLDNVRVVEASEQLHFGLRCHGRVGVGCAARTPDWPAGRPAHLNCLELLLVDVEQVHHLERHRRVRCCVHAAVHTPNGALPDEFDNFLCVQCIRSALPCRTEAPACGAAAAGARRGTRCSTETARTRPSHARISQSGPGLATPAAQGRGSVNRKVAAGAERGGTHRVQVGRARAHDALMLSPSPPKWGPAQ